MKKITTIFSLFVFSSLFLLSCKKNADEKIKATVFQASGDITGKLNEFRQLLGDLATTPQQQGGRREINWDGVPDSLTNQPLPNDFFNATGTEAPTSRQRGIVYAGSGQFMVSNNSFQGINAAASSQFASFSGNRSFANVSSNRWQIDPKVAGETTAASVKAFGMVVDDVDVENSTAIEFFEDRKSLGKFFVPPHNNTSSFSFLGVYFENHFVTTIEVTHQGILSSGEKDITQGGPNDLVVMDDFIYSNPVKRQQ